MEDREVPDEWREANVVQIFKNGSRGEASNYRPVSLTSQISKVFESIIRNEVVSFFERYGVIKETQHGFRKGKLCLTNLLVFLDRITRCIDEGGSMDVVFFGPCKGIQQGSPQETNRKFAEIRNRGKTDCVTESWLSNRRQRVCITGVMSGWMRVLSGVPQGSVLGALLFLVYINDLDTGLINKLLKFADDMKVFGKVTDRSAGESIQEDLNTLVDWADRWKMEFNVNKCKLMHG